MQALLGTGTHTVTVVGTSWAVADGPAHHQWSGEASFSRKGSSVGVKILASDRAEHSQSISLHSGQNGLNYTHISTCIQFN